MMEKRQGAYASFNVCRLWTIAVVTDKIYNYGQTSSFMDKKEHLYGHKYQLLSKRDLYGQQGANDLIYEQNSQNFRVKECVGLNTTPR